MTEREHKMADADVEVAPQRVGHLVRLTDHPVVASGIEIDQVGGRCVPGHHLGLRVGRGHRHQRVNGQLDLVEIAALLAADLLEFLEELGAFRRGSLDVQAVGVAGGDASDPKPEPPTVIGGCGDWTGLGAQGASSSW